MQAYLQSSKVVDSHHPTVLEKSRVLAAGKTDVTEIAKACFEWVRDHIQHSGDIKQAGSARSASEVLESGHGWCFGKSHLLVALLRANSIPAAFGYQRLSKGEHGDFTLHGLVSIHLPEHGWYRVDPRGNKTGVNAQFNPPIEQLAWPIVNEGEIDFLQRFAEPLQSVCEWIPNNSSHQQALDTLPDAMELS